MHNYRTYEYGLERICVYAAAGKTEYVYDGRGSVVAVGIGYLVYIYVTNPKKLKQDLTNVKTAVTNLPKTAASVKDAFVSGAKTVANVYSANAINYAANRDKIVGRSLTYSIWAER